MGWMRVDPAGNLLALIDKDKQNNKQIGLFSLSFTMSPRSWQESTEHRSTFPIRQTSSSRILIPVMQTENPMRFQKNLSVILSNSVSDPDNPLESRRLGKNPQTGPEHFQNPKILEESLKILK